MPSLKRFASRLSSRSFQAKPWLPFSATALSSSSAKDGALISGWLYGLSAGNVSAFNQHHYAGNRLSSVDNVANTYQYDANGNAVTDGRNGMGLTYNFLNLPATANGNGTSVAYTYNAAGQKLNKSSLYNGVTTSRDYIEGIEYKNNVIELIHTEEGIAQNNGGELRPFKPRTMQELI